MDKEYIGTEVTKDLMSRNVRRKEVMFCLLYSLFMFDWSFLDITRYDMLRVDPEKTTLDKI